MKKKNVCITGAYGGLGRAFALAFNTDGWDIIATGRNREKLHQFNWDTFKVDVKSEDDINALSDYITDKYGKLDLLTNISHFKQFLIE